MSKYIVDIDDFEPHFKVDSIGVFGIGKSLSYSEEDQSWSIIKYIEEFEELNSDYINEHYGELQDEAYQRGLEDAWEAARKIALMDTETSENITGYFGLFRIMENLTPMQAIEKLKAYEDKRSDRIEVGDEVRFLPNDRKGIVTACHVPDVYAENDKYAVFCGTTVEYVLRQHITKTGKHYDIQSILEAMRK